MKNWIIFGGIALVGYYLFDKAKKFYEGLDISFQNISVKGDAINPIVVIELKIKNPSNASVNINEIQGNILYKDKIIGTVKSLDKETIEPDSILFYDLEINSTFGGIAEIVKNFFLYKNSFDFYFDGTINLNGFTLPYKSKLAW